MAAGMDWSHDFCLNCDKQAMDGEAYCSQACRLADLERGWPSTNPSAGSYSSSRRASSHWEGTSTTRSQGSRLPSSAPFAAYKSAPTSPISYTLPHPHTSSNRSSQSSYYFAQAASRNHHAAGTSSSAARLSPSSSRSSLSSVSSHTANQNGLVLSEETRLALQNYVSSFDQSRNKRRITLA